MEHLSKQYKTKMLCWVSLSRFLFLFFFSVLFIYFTLQYCIGFFHTLTWIRHGCTCVPHSEPPSHLQAFTRCIRYIAETAVGRELDACVCLFLFYCLYPVLKLSFYHHCKMRSIAFKHFFFRMICIREESYFPSSKL